MGFKAYRKKAETIHENQAFSTLCSYLSLMWENKAEELTLFGNVSFYVNEREFSRKYDFDAIAITNNLVIIIDFKDFGGWLKDNNTSKEEPWLMYDGDKITFKIKGGSQSNPYVQLEKNRKGLAKFIEKNYISQVSIKEIEDKCNGLVIFHKEVKNLKEANGRLDRNVLSWFCITDLELDNVKHYMESLSRKSTFTVSELDKLCTALKDRVPDEFTSFPRIKNVNIENSLKLEIDNLLLEFEWLKKNKNNEFVKKLTKFKEEYSINLADSIDTILKLNYGEFVSKKNLISDLSYIEIKESEINFAKEIKKNFSFQPILYLEEEFDIEEYGYSIRSRDKLRELVKGLEDSIEHLKSTKEYEFMDYILKNNMNYFGETKRELTFIKNNVLEYFKIRDNYCRVKEQKEQEEYNKQKIKREQEIREIEREQQIKMEEERLKIEQEILKEKIRLEEIRLKEKAKNNFIVNMVFISLFVLLIMFNIFVYFKYNIFSIPSSIATLYVFSPFIPALKDIVFGGEFFCVAIAILFLWGIYALYISLSIWWLLLIIAIIVFIVFLSIQLGM